MHAESPQSKWHIWLDYASSHHQRLVLPRLQDYLGELEMATSGAIMALRLTVNDNNSSQIDLNSRAREARNMTFALRQRHLDVMLKNAGQPMRIYGDLRR